MNSINPFNFHTESFNSASAELNRLRHKIGRMGWFRLICFTGVLAGIWLILRNDNAGYYLAFSSIVLFLIAVKRYITLHKRSKLVELQIELHALELEALSGKYDGFDDGKQFIDPSHPYSFDLDIFGHHSLFNQVCRTISASGINRLADLLSSPVSTFNELNERQKLVQSFAANPQFGIDFRVAGGGIAKLTKPDFEAKLINWIQTEHHFLMNRLIRILVRASSLSVGVLIVLKFILSLSFAWFIPPLIFNFLLLGFHLRKINSINSQSGIITESTATLHKLLLVLQRHSFNSEQLTALSKESEFASGAIHNLNKLLNLFDIRLNMILGAVLNILFLFDFHCLFRIEDWKNRHRHLIQKSYETISFLDVYQSLGNWAFLHPSNTYPVFSRSSTEFNATQLKHPLIQAQQAIGNTLSLGKNEKLVVLTGANMTGKSTWLRTIGLSCIAANCGLPISAADATMPMLNVYTSMRITDSLDTGISYFKAELGRFKCMLDALQESNQTWFN